MQRVRLLKKLAPIINGIDLAAVRVGDVVELPNAAAATLIREGWAEQIMDASETDVRIRIVKQPVGTVGGVSLDSYHQGRVYEVAPVVANYLIIEGLAIVEMRDKDRATKALPKEDRRKKA